MKKRIDRKFRTSETKQPVRLKLAAVSLAVCLGTSSYAVLINGGEPVAKIGITGMLASVFTAISDEFTRVMGVFNAQMTAMDVAVAAAYEFENEQVSSAMKVFVKQMSVSSNMLAENSVKVAQTEAAVEQARLQKERIIETNERLGPQGQGHKVCTVLAERQEASKVVKSNAKNVPSLTSDTVYAAAGAYGSPHKTLTTMNQNHSAKYCTPEQAASGFCSSATDQAGWDVQTSTLFTPTTTNSTVYDAQNALINNMVGLPDAPIPDSLKGSPTSTSYLALKQKKDAITSPAINSLKAIQAEFTGLPTSDSDSQLSPMRAVDDQVKRYLGSGDEYKSWNQTLVSGSESGIMKELLQVQALDLYLQARQYKQNEREELVLAGIVAATQQLIDRQNGASGYKGISRAENEKLKLASKDITTKFYQRNGVGR